MPTASGEIAVEDTVVFKNAGRDAAHWVVEYIGRIVFKTSNNYGRTPVRLLSGRAGIHRAAFLDELEPWVANVDRVGTAELLAHSQIVGEMVAEGIVVRVDEGIAPAILVAKYGSREFLVEVRVFDVTEERI